MKSHDTNKKPADIHLNSLSAPVCDNNRLVYIVPPAVQFLYLMCPVLVYHYSSGLWGDETNRIPVHHAGWCSAPQRIRFADLEYLYTKRCLRCASRILLFCDRIY